MSSADGAALVSAIADTATATFTAIAAGVAVATLLALKRDSADRTRPVMTADIRPGVLSRGTHDLVVENVGQSVARNVRVTFTPDLPDLQGNDAIGKVTPYLKRRYADALPTVPPGRQFTNLYFVGQPDTTGRFQNTEPLPDEIRVTFEYEDAHKKSYRDEYDLKVIWGSSSSDPSDTDPAKLQKRSTRALEVIATALGRRGR